MKMTNEEILEIIRGLQTRLSTVESPAAKNDNITIPRKLANTLLGILESEYEGTEMFQDQINELKGLIDSKCSHEWEGWSVAPARHKGELAKWRHCKKCDKFDFRLEHRYE